MNPTNIAGNVYVDVASDIIISLTYLTISSVIFYTAYKKKNDNLAILLLYGSFILGSGLIHLTNLINTKIDTRKMAVAAIILRGFTAISAAAATAWTIAILPKSLRSLTVTELSEQVERRTAELQRSESKYRFLVDAIPQIVLIATPTGAIDYCNKRWYDYIGLDGSVAPGWAWSEVAHPDDLGSVVALWDRSTAAGQEQRLEFRIRDKSGQYRWHLATVTPRYGDGVIVEWVWTLTDINSQRAVNDALLRRSEERYRLFVEQIQDYAMFILDRDGKIVTWNAGAEKIKGYKTEEVIGKHISIFYPQDDIRDGIPTKVLAEAALLGHYKVEGWRLRRDGQSFWASIVITVLRDDDGNLVGYAKVTRDLSERRAAEEALRLSESKFRSIIDLSYGACIVIDSENTVVEWNNSATRTFQYARVEAIGKNICDLIIPERYRTAHTRGIRYFVETGIGPIMNKVTEMSARRKDGVELPVDIMISHINNNNKIFFAAFILDITERKESERLLRASEQRLQAVLDNSSAVIFVKDVTTEPFRYLLVNQHFENIFGTKKHRIIGKTDADFFPPETVAIWRRNDDEVVNSRSARQFEETLPDPILPPTIENVRTYISIKFPLMYDGDRIVSICGISTDITDLKRIQRALERSNDDLNQFAYVASHDLQEPLRVITGYLQILERRYAEKLDGDAKKYMGRAVEGCLRMRNLIEDLLDYSRVSSRPYQLAATDLSVPLKLAISNLEAAVEECGAEIVVQRMPPALVDEARMAQLYQNLIGNAIKFHKPGKPPTILVGSDVRGNDIIYFVRDDGIGIVPEQIAKLFKIFQRLHTRVEYPGTGIGLAVCKKIIEKHGGKIWVESAGPDQGTTFYFTLPVEQAKHE